jgi:hypothetical protein
MSEANVAYMETANTTHIVTWCQDHLITIPGRQGTTWTTEVVAMCGRKKKYLKHAHMLYPELSDHVVSKPLCKTCADVVKVAHTLLYT